MKLIAIALLGAAACSSLPPLGDAVCGNGVIDPGEDCDGPGPSCVACRVQCVDDACPARGTVAGDPLAGIPTPRDSAAYRCGADNLCHAAGGELELLAASHAFPVVGFGVTDIDHDHVGDIVGLSGTSMLTRFGAAQLPLEAERETITPQLTGAPAIQDLDGDGSTDFVLASRDGLVAYTSASNVLAPFAVAINIGPAATGPTALFPIDGLRIGVFLEAMDQTITGGIVTAASGAGQQPTQFDLCGQILMSTFDYASVDVYNTTQALGPTSFVLSFVAGGTSCVLAVVEDSTTPGTFVATEIGPPNTTPSARPVLADLKAAPDGCPSLVMSGAALTQYVGTNVGGACKLASVATALASIPGEAAIGRIPLDPTAFGDALVTSGGVYAIGAGTVTPFYLSDRKVDTVAFGDVDGDGAIDGVVSLSDPKSGEDNLDVLYRVGSSFRRTRVGTDDVPRRLTIGDFDGDGLGDVLYVETRSPGHDRMLIGYGSRDGVLPAVEVAEFANVITTCPAQLRDSSDPLSRVLDMAVIEDRPTGPKPTDIRPELDIMHGTPERALIPFLDPRPGGGPPSMFTLPAVGRFVPDSKSVDLLTLEVDANNGPPVGGPFWLLAGSGRGSIAAPGAPGSSSGSFPSSGFGYCGAGAYPYCLDDARVVVWSVGDHDLYLVIDRVSGQTIAFDPFTSLSHGTMAAPVVSAHVFPADASPQQAQEVAVFAADTDGDGIAELIIASPPSGVLSCIVDADGAVHGCSSLGLAPTCTNAALGRVNPAGQTATSRFPAADELIVTCGADLVRLSHDATGYSQVKLATLPFEPKTFAVGDITGDAVDDVIVGDGQRVLVYRQLASSEVAR